MPATQKLSRVQRKGQITIPSEMRERLGIEEGDFVAFTETDAGILITPQKLIPADVQARMRAIKDAVSKRAPR